MQNIKTIPQLAVQNLPADLESKADANEVVLLTGNQTVEGNKNLTETPVIQLWNADIKPTANQTIVFSINSVGNFELYKNKTGSNGSNPPDQDGTNWEFISTCQGSRAYVQEFAPSESPVSSITLTEGFCYNADFMTVAVDHTILDPSAYTLGIDGTTITFVEPVESGLTITVRWFTEINLSSAYRQPLLSCFWSDHLIYELSYLCADPFSWQDGNIYSAVYNHLVADIEGKSTTTEGSITYYLADDGHKIATATSHNAVANLYDETGIAWFYILDTTNHRFKLPRTKYAFSGLRNMVGNPIELAASGSEVKSTQMYLYFYVGNYTPQAIEQTAGYAQTLTDLKADKDLANSPYTTNRILEIPQDIKLELNSGTLTIKAGTKGYDGNGLFYTVTSDITHTASANDTYFLYLRDSSPYFRISNKNESGTSVPSGYTGAFFHTDTGICNFYSSGTLTENLSLPIAIITVSNGAISSIDQVFNGFGYIGSTVFVLPGVKVQTPNGRNKDGTYKSGVITSNSVITRAMTGEASDKWIIFSGSGVYLNSKTNEIFDADSNCWKYDGTKQADIGCLGGAYFDGTKISSFTPYNVDSVVNSNLSNLSPAGEAKLKSNIQLVNELPDNPEQGVLYCIPEA